MGGYGKKIRGIQILRISYLNYEYVAKLMFGNAVEISLIFRRILGPLVLGWAPNHFVLGTQLAPGE